MMEDKLEVGRLVMAKAGRDKGKTFIIIGRLDEEYVLIANGVGRTIDKPKKKKVKHLKTRPEVATDLARKLNGGDKVIDADLRKSLRSMGYDK
ncbi:MAG TPA: RNA-binding protein [Bacillota bacterium]|nr:RNA-binding protein [Bacillota bacterium]